MIEQIKREEHEAYMKWIGSLDRQYLPDDPETPAKKAYLEAKMKEIFPDKVEPKMTSFNRFPEDGDRHYFITYYREMAPLFRIKSLMDVKVLWQLTQYAEFSTGVVVLSPERRKHISSVTGVSLNNLPKHLASLKALGLITGERNDYMISPVIFWRGANKERNAFLDTDEGRRVVLEFRKVTEDGEEMDENKKVNITE